MLNLDPKSLFRISAMLQEFSCQISDEVGCRITLKITEIEHANMRDNTAELITVKSVKAAVCEHFGITEEKLCSTSRERPMPEARFICYRLIKEKHPDMPLKTIGMMHGHRDHSSVIHGMQTLNDWLEKEKTVQENYKAINEILNPTQQ